MKLLAIFTLVVSVVAYSTTKSLVQINDRNFKLAVLESNKYVFVDFYADWCRHCKKLMPTMEELVGVFSDYDNIEIVKLNGDTDGKIMARKYAPKGFPTLVLFNGSNDPIEFEGSRDLESLSNFLQQATGIRLEKIDKTPKIDAKIQSKSEDTPSVVALSDNNFSELVEDSNSPIVVTIGATWCKYCQNLDPIIENLANEIYINDPIQFGKITIDTHPSDEIQKKFNIETIPTVLLFNSKLEKEPVIFKGEQSYQKLLDSINKYYGLSRDSNGDLLPNSGNIKEIDDLIQAKLDLDVVEISKQGLTYLSNLSSPKAAYYKTILNKLLDGDKSFISFELLRINSILLNDYEKLSRRTIDSLKERLNVLEVFSKI